MTKMWMPFNVNDTVKVRLNMKARQYLNERHAAEIEQQRCSGVFVDDGPAFVLDEEGYWNVPLWEVMQKLGPLCYHGSDSFGTTILFGVEDSEHPFVTWDGCQPKDSPFPPGIDDRTTVEVVFRNGQVHTGPAQTFGWAHSGYHPETQIVRYRIL